MSTNSDHFDLSNWKITLPVDSSGRTDGTAVEVQGLEGYEDPRFFYDSADGAMVFRASTDGATTSGSKYPRTELREMKGDERAAWDLKQGGTLTATLKIDEAPIVNGTPGRIIVGQIHGKADELVRLYWENGKVYFKNDQAGSNNKELRFDLTNDAGENPDISIGEKFSYKIEARGDKLVVEVHTDGQIYKSVSDINDVWQSDQFYFKAGVYLGVNDSQGSGVGQASFYGLDFGHKPGEGLGGLVDYTASEQNARPQPEDPQKEESFSPDESGTNEQADKSGTENAKDPTEADDGQSQVGVNLGGTDAADTLQGTRGSDKLYGREGDDIIRGGDGNDTLWGNGGADLLDGGVGDDWLKGGDSSDSYYFGADHGHDTVHEFRTSETLIFDDDLFGSKEDFLAALSKTPDGIRLVTGDNSSILFTKSTMSEVQSASIVIAHSAESSVKEVAFQMIEDTSIISTSEPETEIPEIAEPILVSQPQPDTVSPKVSHEDAMANGTSADDVVDGTDASDVLKGRAGDDALYGFAGDDTLLGNSGDDILVGGAGNDWIKGGNGADTIIFTGAHGADIVHQFRSNDTLILEGSRFANAREAKDALVMTDEGIELATANGASILFTGTSMNHLQNADWILN
ncbi:Hemolysin-type calcium-binding repeat-containing protein [Fulvimarina manganoxydans]|uniref:Hemolysin-type calcium-binding repeat-containing protein n=2 Tax=Fulvimarina manganoxydans TaxID=937218 RepID=A0A1W2DLA2_9HYPH|nr:Hemolysin-type calcium-binding repeat-containing protein [Fulvimarina manganoxydans]